MSKATRPFYAHSCQFTHCDEKFASVSDLVRHVEYTHLDFSQQYLERVEQAKPAMVPLSYILRMFPPEDENESKEDKTKTPSVQTVTIAKNDELPSGASLAETIASVAAEVLPVEQKAKSIYKCHCGKSYKTANGLKNHSVTHNSILTLTNPPNKDGEITSKTTLALLIQAQSIKDSEMLAKLANGTLSTRDSSVILPLPGGKSYIPIEFTSTSGDPNTKIVFTSAIATTAVLTAMANSATDSVAQTIDSVVFKNTDSTPSNAPGKAIKSDPT